MHEEVKADPHEIDALLVIPRWYVVIPLLVLVVLLASVSYIQGAATERDVGRDGERHVNNIDYRMSSQMEHHLNSVDYMLLRKARH